MREFITTQSTHEPDSIPSCRGSEGFELLEPEEASLTPEDLAALQNWLQPTDYLAESSEFHRHLHSQAPGTGLWFCDTPRFQQWHDLGEHSSLWIKGVPGAGISVIAASMIDNLKKEGLPVLFFFFPFIILANRRPRSLIRDWLAQLLPHSLRLQATLQPMVKGELEGISDDELWDYLLIGLSSVKKAYCVVDAMDEMEQLPNDKFLHKLNALSTFRPGIVKVLMTSRPKQYLQSALREVSIVHINLEQDLVGKDIAAFVSHRLRSIPQGEGRGSLLKSLQSIICSRSQGLFLYARLLLDQIIPSLSSAAYLDVNSLASTLPIGLENMYNSMLSLQAKKSSIDTRIQEFLLECATHSSQPLRLNELADFWEIVFSSSNIATWSKEVVRSACTPLLEIAEDESVQGMFSFPRLDGQTSILCEPLQMAAVAHCHILINASMKVL
jgi:hypothetical protein